VVTAFPRDDADVITPWLGQFLLGLKGRGLDVSVLAPSYRGGGTTRWRGITVHRFRYAPARFERLTHEETAPDRLRAKPWYAGLLPAYVCGGSLSAFRLGLGRPDIVHAHWPLPHALFGAMTRLGSGGDTAVVASYYSVELRWVEERLPLFLPFLRWTMESADAITAISRPTARAVGRYVERPVRVIPFAAAVPPSVDSSHRSSGDERGTGSEILFVGRLVERKGVETLVRALAALTSKRRVRLTIVGEGTREARIRSLIDALELVDRVRLTGALSDLELAAAYDRADLFVLPAVVDAKGDTEGLGVVLLEALRSGVPVIGSRVGGIPDIVIDGETGWLVPPGDPRALAAAIDEALDDPREARRRVALGQRHVERHFSMPRILDAMIACYEDAIAARTGHAP